MNLKPICIVAGKAACVFFLSGCAARSNPPIRSQVGESLVFVGETPAALAWFPTRSQVLDVRSTYLPSTNTIHYVQGRDFVIDYANGTLSRTAASRLPDFRTNILFGQDGFDHTKFPGFGNRDFFAYMDYSFRSPNPWPVQTRQTDLLKRTQAKLKAGAVVKIVAFGDSITAGGDVSKPGNIFWNRWVDDLQRKYPSAQVTALNKATGGDTTAQGLERLNAKVIDEHPDLVLIGFGMNDHNLLGFGVPLPQFEQNLKEMIGRIRQDTTAEVVLYSAFPPNPRWKYGSNRMADYAAATRHVAQETACAYADVFANWQALAARKKPEDLLGNNINHPNDFGHWIYYSVLREMGL